MSDVSDRVPGLDAGTAVAELDAADIWSIPLDIDKDRPTPAYLQLREQLVDAISHGTLPAGSALPSERGLATKLCLSPMTVRRAFEQLVEAGLVEQRQGSGTYVRGQPLEQVIDRVLGFTDEARSLGLAPGSRMLSAGVVNADDLVANALGLELGARVLRITRLRTADGKPLALQEAHLVSAHLDLSLELLAQTGSLYRTL